LPPPPDDNPPNETPTTLKTPNSKQNRTRGLSACFTVTVQFNRSAELETSPSKKISWLLSWKKLP